MEKNLQKFGLFMGNRAQNSSLPIMDIKEKYEYNENEMYGEKRDIVVGTRHFLHMH